MKNVRDWISDNPKTFAGICTASLIIAIVIIASFPMVAAYVVISAIVLIVSLVFFVYFIYTFILSLVEEFLC